MGQTPNYRWVTPEDSAQVRQGAAAMRSLGNSIDASLKSVDTAYKAAVADVRADYLAADAVLRSTATTRWAGSGGRLTRTATQATASTTVDGTLAMDGVQDLRGGATGGATLSLGASGLYVVGAQLEVGVGSGGDLSISVRTTGGGKLCTAAGPRNGAVRTVLSCSTVFVLTSAHVLTLAYTTSAAMTITHGMLWAYQIGAS